MTSSLWSEKYKPEKLSDMPIQEDVIEDLKGFVTGGSLPHMLFAGPSGSGRTMVALAVAREFYGDGHEQYFLTISCSDEGVMVRRKLRPGEEGGEIQKAKRRSRGSGTKKRLRIREKILQHVGSPPMDDAPHKILYLLDFDSEDSRTQNALRRPMETYSENCRFIIAAENTSSVIDPLQSRCATFRFGRPSDEKIREILRGIEENEKVELTEEGAEAIIRISDRNIQKAINLFQAASSLEERVNRSAVYEASSVSRPEEVRKMMSSAYEGDFKDAQKKLRNILIKKGTEPEDVLKQIQDEIHNLDAPEPVKVKLVEKMGDFDFDLVRGKTGRVQIERVLAHLGRIGNRVKS